MNIEEYVDELYTTQEVADFLRVSEQTVRHLVDRGKLRARHVGRMLRFAKSDVQAYLAAQEVRDAGS